MSVKLSLLATGVLLSTALLTGCTTTPQTSETNNPVDSHIRVTASFYPMYYFASEIGGDLATVTNLTPAGAEPHDYELTPTDIASIQDSDLLVLNGGQFEPWAEDVTANLSDRTTVVEAGAGIDYLVGEEPEHEHEEEGDHADEHEHEEEGEHEHEHGGLDPHVWLSPTLAKQQVEAITNSFIQADPDHSDAYQSNSDNLLDRLDQLDQAYQTGLANCVDHTIITSHAAFSYLASDYALEQLPIAGLSPETEPTLDELADITNFAKEHNVHYIFFESLVSPDLSETIATEVGAQTLVLNPIEGLTDEDIAAGNDYFTVMQDNLTNLRTALQCQ